LLWEQLRAGRLDGLKFRRKHAVGPYVVDFASLRHRLVVEVDGPVHALKPDDGRRDAWLTAQGFRILRFPAADVRERTERVLASILEATRPEQRPSPLAGEGGRPLPAG